ncbi:MAG TPA: dienelactone hydrolase family protein [Oligoflexus sp.]|uniref:dienelactone hydrolase family protein n=1 Tax=Oligoflexus sp. TaxID=1971216 RepID=UPI002D35601C|nr:dienelactone hydrolase family protein [Oligoflexus sp.]HYX32916.1 dienelactone hydrolase family protein [Oligoflexus sp.]
MFLTTTRMIACISLMVSSVALSANRIQTVTYEKNAEVFEGLLVSPENIKPQTPAILMIHSRMGVTAETQHQAERMANLGFIVFAADIYGRDSRPTTVEESRVLTTKYRSDRKLFRERLNLGLDILKQQEHVNTDMLFAVGYCFGGTGVLELARSGADIVGVASFHGGLDSPTPDDGAQIQAKVLVLHGADDPTVSATNLAAFENEMRMHKVDWQLVKYGGTVHSFTDKSAGSDPSTGSAYNPVTDRRSFEAFKNFSAESLEQTPSQEPSTGL